MMAEAELAIKTSLAISDMKLAAKERAAAEAATAEKADDAAMAELLKASIDSMDHGRYAEAVRAIEQAEALGEI
ncbi:hypothetical protein IJT17_09830, partial [bacterium]|nr:hypothetical protein [bacterium]